MNIEITHYTSYIKRFSADQADYCKVIHNYYKPNICFPSRSISIRLRTSSRSEWFILHRVYFPSRRNLTRPASWEHLQLLGNSRLADPSCFPSSPTLNAFDETRSRILKRVSWPSARNARTGSLDRAIDPTSLSLTEQPYIDSSPMNPVSANIIPSYSASEIILPFANMLNRIFSLVNVAGCKFR